MASLVAIQSGNLTTAATWYAVNTNSGFVDGSSVIIGSGVSVASTTYPSVTSSYTSAMTAYGIGVKIRVLSTPAGNVSFVLYDTTSSTALATVTVNANTLVLGWNVFTFGAVTITASHTWEVQIVTSAGFTGSFNFMGSSSGSTTAMNKLLLTNTTGAPVATNQLIIPAIFNGSTVVNPAVTISTNDANVYGVSGATTWVVSIAGGSTLQYAYAASSTYNFSYKGMIEVFGSFTMGTSANPIPATSTATLNYQGAAAGDGGILGRTGLGGPACTIIAYGTPPTYTRCRLNANAAAAATTITTDVSTGWLSGNTVIISGTTSTSNNNLITTLNGNASGTTLTLTAGLPSATDGNATCKAYIMLHNRNVAWTQSVGGSPAYTIPGATLYGVQLNDITTLLTAGTLQYCGFQGTASAAALTVTTMADHCNFYNTTAMSGTGLTYGTTTTSSLAAITITNNWVIGLSTGFNLAQYAVGSPAFSFSTFAQIDNNVACGCSTGFNFGTINIPTTNAMTGNVALSCGTAFNFTANWVGDGILIASATAQRCSTGMYLFSGNYTIPIPNRDAQFQNLTITGCFLGIGLCTSGPILFSNVTISSETSYSGTYTTSGGIGPGSSTFAEARAAFNSLTFVSNTVDFSQWYNYMRCVLQLYNATLSSGTPLICTTGNMTQVFDDLGSIVSLKEGGTAGNDKIYLANGSYGIADTTYYVNTSPAMRLYPATTNNVTRLRGYLAPITSGSTPIVSIQIRCDSTYTGAAPKLYICANYLLGYSADTVVATYSGAAGSFRTLTATLANAALANCVAEYMVEVNGAVGFITIDEFQQTPAPTKQNSYFGQMTGPFMASPNKISGSGAVYFAN